MRRTTAGGRAAFGPSFDVSAEENDIICRIVDRAIFVRSQAGIATPRDEKMTLVMDITACHANGTPLHLTRLLNADNFNFMHDVNGIQRHIDRKTGALLDCFTPRSAVQQ